MSNKTKAAEPVDATEVRFSIRAMLIGTAIAAVVFTSLGAFIQHFPANVQPRLLLFWSIQTAAITVLIAYHMRRRILAERKAGRVLMLLPLHSYFLPRAPQFACVGTAIFLLLFAVGICVSDSFEIAAAPLGGWWFPVNIYATILAGIGVTHLWWRRVRIAENGIVVRSNFVPWPSFRRWYWNACNKDVAVVERLNGGDVAFKVPEQDRAAIEALFERYVYVRHGYVPFKEKA